MVSEIIQGSKNFTHVRNRFSGGHLERKYVLNVFCFSIRVICIRFSPSSCVCITRRTELYFAGGK